MGAVMTNHDCTGELARLLDVERSVANALLIDFSSAMAAELLDAQKLSLRGLGSFTVTHFPAAKKSTASTIVYTPPCNRLTFSSRISGVDDAVRLAVTKLSMSLTDAERFGRSIESLFSGAVQQQREIRLNGIGRFALEQGRYGFVPESSLEELLNREYKDLLDIVLPKQGQKRGMKERRTLRYAIALSLTLLIVLLLAFFSGVQPNAISPPLSVSQPGYKAGAAIQGVRAAEVVSKDIASVTESSVPAHYGRGSAARDSLVLDRNRYTVVLVTFRREATIRKEVARFRSKGVVAFVWPAYEKGVKFYRIVTGSFSNRSEAVEYIGRMSGKNGGNAYIQHVIKRVVLYGEKGL